MKSNNKETVIYRQLGFSTYGVIEIRVKSSSSLNEEEQLNYLYVKQQSSKIILYIIIWDSILKILGFAKIVPISDYTMEDISNKFPSTIPTERVNKIEIKIENIDSKSLKISDFHNEKKILSNESNINAEQQDEVKFTKISTSMRGGQKFADALLNNQAPNSRPRKLTPPEAPVFEGPRWGLPLERQAKPPKAPIEFTENPTGMTTPASKFPTRKAPSVKEDPASRQY